MFIDSLRTYKVYRFMRYIRQTATSLKTVIIFAETEFRLIFNNFQIFSKLKVIRFPEKHTKIFA